MKLKPITLNVRSSIGNIWNEVYYAVITSVDKPIWNSTNQSLYHPISDVLDDYTIITWNALKSNIA